MGIYQIEKSMSISKSDLPLVKITKNKEVKTMKIGSGISIFFNHKREICCRNCGKDLKKKDDEETPPLVLGKHGQNYCINCGYKLKIITGVVYHS